jgi:hypothetical protein
MRSRILGTRSTLVVLWLAGLLLLPGSIVPAAAERPERVANVLVFSTAQRTPLVVALGTDTAAIRVTVITNETLASMPLAAFNESLTLADVVFVDRFLPENLSYLHLLVSHVNGTMGHDGLVMFGIMQNSSVPGDGDLSSSQVSVIAPILPVDLLAGYMNSTGNSSAPGYIIQVEPAPIVPENSSILVECIPWSACPLIDRRLVVAAKPAGTIILTDLSDAETVLAEWFLGENGSRVMFFSMEIAEHNIAFTTFPYFDYLMYVCAFHAMHNYSDALIESWEEWPFSSGHGGGTPWVWIVAIIVLVGVAFWLYLQTRKKTAKPGEGKADGMDATVPVVHQVGGQPGGSRGDVGPRVDAGCALRPRGER